MATSTQLSFLNNQCNSAPPILTSGTSQIPPLDDIRDILSIIKSTTRRLTPQNAHWSLKSTYQGLDFASTKIQNYHDVLKGAPSSVGLNEDTASAFFDVSDTLLNVVRAVEEAPIAISYAAKIKHPLKEIWRFLKRFGPFVCERQQRLRKIYCSILDVVIKVQVSLDAFSEALHFPSL
jgi:hypothetical protein